VAVDTIAGGVPDDIRADYLACYGGDRFAESMRYVRRYPEELPALAELLPQIATPVTIINGRHDRVVPLGNAEFLDERLSTSRLAIIDLGGGAGGVRLHHPRLDYGQLVMTQASPTLAHSQRSTRASQGGEKESASSSAPSPGGGPAPNATQRSSSMTPSTQTVELSQLTAPNITVEAANGITYAYRRFGTSDDRWPPLLFLQHFRGNLDNWDPLLVDPIAAHREVILLDNTGVGLSSGKVPVTVTEMARDAIAFLDALEIGRVDLLGYSLGGMVAQELALLRPRNVRRIVLAGTGPRGGPQMHGWIFDIERTANNANNGIEELLQIFFEITETSRVLGREYVQRAFSRLEGADKPNGPEVARAQYDAIVE
jgi:pimeloyl-ACP methyl ester carboxylesterase